MDKLIKEVLNKIISNGYDAYLVGGYVRDKLLGINSNDIDIATNMPFKDVKELFKYDIEYNQDGHLIHLMFIHPKSMG